MIVVSLCYHNIASQNLFAANVCAHCQIHGIINFLFQIKHVLNKAISSDKETSFLDWNIKVIGSDIHTGVYDKRDGFSIVNFPGLNGDVPILPSYGIYISQLVRFARCCTSVYDFNSKISKLLQNCWHMVIDITSFQKKIGKFSRSCSELL